MRAHVLSMPYYITHARTHTRTHAHVLEERLAWAGCALHWRDGNSVVAVVVVVVVQGVLCL